ncbi:gremlin-1-like [Anolis sagrei]|uniref:gremlin-1-like n=1 Tax=Anolis sagrei TaxID=38937 RepID=UPI0035209268
MDYKSSTTGVLILLGLLLHMLEGQRIPVSEGFIHGKDLDKRVANNSDLLQQCQDSKYSNNGKPNLSCDEETELIPGTLYVTEENYLNQGWCKTQELMQTIYEEGCKSYTFLNRFCYGQCNSFYIPWHIHDKRGVFQGCYFCKPKRFTTTSVTLHCPDLLPPRKRMMIRQVEECHCIPVDVD